MADTKKSNAERAKQAVAGRIRGRELAREQNTKNHAHVRQCTKTAAAMRKAGKKDEEIRAHFSAQPSASEAVAG